MWHPLRLASRGVPSGRAPFGARQPHDNEMSGSGLAFSRDSDLETGMGRGLEERLDCVRHPYDCPLKNAFAVLS